MEIEFFFIFEYLIHILDIFGESIKEPDWFIDIQVVQQVKGLHADLLVPQKTDDPLIDMQADVAHDVLTSFVRYFDYPEDGFFKVEQAVGQVVKFFRYLCLSRKQCEFVFGQMKLFCYQYFYCDYWVLYVYLHLLGVAA